jgi:hypothetical protein
LPVFVKQVFSLRDKMSSTAGAIDQQQRAGGNRAVQQQLVVAALWMVLGLAIVLATLLVVRRISGVFQQPLGGAAIVLFAVVAELGVFSFRRLAIRQGLAAAQYSVLSTQYSLLYVLPTVLAIAALLSLTIPGTPLFGLLLAWLIVLAGETAQLYPHFRPIWDRTLPPPPPVAPPVPTPPPLPSAVVNERSEIEPAESESSEIELEEPEIPAGLIQQLTRVLEDDHESIHALVQTKIPANDRQAILHISFCPPLADKPELTAHALDSANADVRITQVETFGARLEVRLPTRITTEQNVVIEILGSAKATKSVAAPPRPVGELPG